MRKKRKNGEPKKSTGRDGGHSNSKQDKQTLKEKKEEKKIPGSGIVEFQS
jgi:hypothetical protein